VREDSAIGNPELRSWRADLGLAVQDRICVSRTGEDLVARVCEQRRSELIWIPESSEICVRRKASERVK
jgi:hypothetical protein